MRPCHCRSHKSMSPALSPIPDVLKLHTTLKDISLTHLANPLTIQIGKHPLLATTTKMIGVHPTSPIVHHTTVTITHLPKTHITLLHRMHTTQGSPGIQMFGQTNLLVPEENGPNGTTTLAPRHLTPTPWAGTVPPLMVTEPPLTISGTKTTAGVLSGM
jgi:hypothetical protein